MKAYSIAIPGLIAVGLLVASAGTAQDVLTTGSSSVPSYVRWERAGTLVSIRTDVDWPQGRESGSAAYGSHLDPDPDVQLEPSIPNDPYLDRQWALKQIQMPQPYQFAPGSRKVLVAVLDTGVDGSHEDLTDRVVVAVNFTSSPVADDIRGHGTHIAGIIAANSNNGRGIAGVAPASLIMSVKVADDSGKIQAAAAAKGIIWAVKNGASVINVSIEFEEPSADLEYAVNYAWRQGVLVVAAAGNRGGQLPVYPAYYENCIAVAGLTWAGTLAPLSNHGDWVDVVAPGFAIYSTLPGNSYGYKSGTSFAAAHISGLAALLFPVTSDTNSNGRVNDEVRAAIEAGWWQFDAVVSDT